MQVSKLRAERHPELAGRSPMNELGLQDKFTLS